MINTAIIRKAKEGEINFIFSELTHILKDLITGETFGVSGRALETYKLSEGDIVEYTKECNGGQSYTLVIDKKIIPFYFN
jgi:hypothetical protein